MAQPGKGNLAPPAAREGRWAPMQTSPSDSVAKARQNRDDYPLIEERSNTSEFSRIPRSLSWELKAVASSGKQARGEASHAALGSVAAWSGHEVPTASFSVCAANGDNAKEEEEEEEDDVEEADDEDVAERVLLSLQQKDEVIEGLYQENTKLRLEREELVARLHELSHLEVKEIVKDRAVATNHHPVSKNTFVVEELEQRCAELERQLACERANAQVGTLNEPKSLHAGSISRIKELELQVDEILQDKRADVGMLRELVLHLQSQLRDKTSELKEKEGIHRRELAGLQEEIQRLSSEFNAQVGGLQDQLHLQSQLERAKQRQREIIFENEQMQRRWGLELEAQRSRTEELKAMSEETQKELTQATDALQQQAAEKDSLREELARAQMRLEGLQEVHARASDEIAQLRLDNSQLAGSVAELTLQLQASLTAAVEPETSVEAWKALQQQVEGCVQSSAFLEQALKHAQERQHLAEEEARKAIEACEAARTQAQAQCHREVLEHQQLAASMTSFHREQLDTLQKRLHEQAEAHVATKEELSETLHQLQDLLQKIVVLREERDAAVAAHGEAKTAQVKLQQQLMHAKEEARGAHSKQLLCSQHAQELEKRLTHAQRRQQELTAAARQAGDREQALLRALEGLSRDPLIQRISSEFLRLNRGSAKLAKTPIPWAIAGRTANDDVTHDYVEVDSGPSDAVDGAPSSVATTTPPPRGFPFVVTSSMSLSSAMKLLQGLKQAIHQLLEQRSGLKKSLSGKQAAVLAAQRELRQLQQVLQEQGDQHERARRLLSEQCEHFVAASQANMQAALRELERSTVANYEATVARYDAALAAVQQRAVEAARKELQTSLFNPIATLPYAFLNALTHRGAGNAVPLAAITLDDNGRGVPDKGSEELSAECDAITRELLGLSGGWSELCAEVNRATGLTAPKG